MQAPISRPAGSIVSGGVKFSFFIYCGLALFTLIGLIGARAQAEDLLPFDVKLQEVLAHDDGKFLWYHARPASLPGQGNMGPRRCLLTLQKHLIADDHYSGMFVMDSTNDGRSWEGPNAVPELDWQTNSAGETIAVCDVTPRYHPPSGKLLLIGIKLRYSKEGLQLLDQPRSHEAAYAIHDPKSGSWTGWKVLELPDTESRFYLAAPGCGQWVVDHDGTILLPLYRRGPTDGPYVTTVVRCRFDGETLTLLEQGNELELNVERGLCEPSLAAFGGKYWLTVRNDQRGYVTHSSDGLHYEPIVPWVFDDGSDLGSYNTQQHWLVHSAGLFLVYTRRGANNDHIIRHRAPLFMAQVDPDKPCVIRKTERVVIPERGGEYGNFGAAEINAQESWVTSGEGVWSNDARARGAKGSVFVARILWSRPNQLVSDKVAAPRAPNKTDRVAAKGDSPQRSGAEISVALRARHRDESSGKESVAAQTEQWKPGETAIVVVDMWDKHHCRSAEQRVGEMAPKMNETLKQARKKGILIVHAPSNCMEAYTGTASRRRAQVAPQVEAPITFQWNNFDPAREAPLAEHLEKAGCSCDTAEPCGPSERVWTRQTPLIEIDDADAVSDDGQEVYNLFMQRGIKNVIIMGVHTNRCVLGRPFGIRQLVHLKMNVVLCRDLTDSYHRDPGHHFAGLREIIAHVERSWCPTMASSSLTDAEPFRFAADSTPIEE